jgi:uncharacterized membrane protein HdeD (DUF308 family)
MWWWFLLLGILWTLFGMFVLSYRVGSLTAVAVFVGVAFIFGGITQIQLAAWVFSWRWLFILFWDRVYRHGSHDIRVA